MSSPAPQLTAVFRACVVNAVKDGEVLIGQLIRSTRSELADAEQRASGIHERMHLSDALLALDKHEAALIKGYPMALLEIFAEGASGSKSRAALDTGIDFGELSLVDDRAVMEQVELARAQQIASHVTDAALSELNTYVSSVQGLPRVQPERNPLRPENYIRGLQRVVDESGVSAEIRQLWMQHMRELLGAELVSTYQQITRSLREHGVRPVGYSVAGMPGGSRNAPLAGAENVTGPHDFAASTGMPAGAWAGRGAQPFMSPMPVASAAQSAEESMLAVGILRQMLAAGGDPYSFDWTNLAGLGAAGAQPAAMKPPGAAGLDGAQGMAAGMPAFTPTQAAEAMEDFAQLERLVGRLAGGVAPSGIAAMAPGTPRQTGVAPIAPTHWQGMSIPAQLPRAAEGAARSATEVLSRMMEHISQDSRLLAPVQRAVQNLEPALKQLVRIDPSFFSNEQHPARRLLDGLTQRSLAFKAEDSRGFRKYIQLVNAAVQHLATVPVHDAKAFEHVSDALESAWNTQVQQLRKQQETEQAALELSERRDLLATRIAQQFRLLPDASSAPEDILDFVTGPWARVAAQAQIDAEERGGEDAPDPNQYLAVVPQLLLCSSPAGYSPTDARRMLPLMEGMFGTIRDGLYGAGHGQEEVVRVLKRIAGLQMQLAKHAAAADAVTPDALADEPLARPGPSIEAPLDGEGGPSGFQTVHGGLDLDLSRGVSGEAADGALEEQAGEPQAAQAVPIVAEHADAVAPAAAPVEPAEPVDAPAHAAAAQDCAHLFELGQWIELTTNSRTVRTQLTWVSPHNTLFLFTALDASTQSMTRRMLDKLYAEGHVRRVDDQRVVARALGAAQARGYRDSGPDSQSHRGA